MPTNAIEHDGRIDKVGTADELGRAVCYLTEASSRQGAVDACLYPWKEPDI